MHKICVVFSAIGLCFFLQVRTTLSQNRSYSYLAQQSVQPCTPCDLSKLDLRIATMEVLTNKRFDLLTTDLIDVNKHLASVEYQTTVQQNGVAELRKEIRRLAGILQTTKVQSTTSPVLDRKVDDVAQGTHLATAALTLLAKDVYALKQNFSELLTLLRSNLQNPPNSSKLCEDTQIRQSSSPKNCLDVKENNPQSPSGIYSVKPNDDASDLMVVCDMETSGGGWLVIQNRQDGSQDFYLNFEDYKMGFGNLAGEFWLGLENIYRLTGNQVNELLIELTDANNVKTSAHYSAFSIGPEETGYPLKVLAGYTGDAGDSLSYHAGQKFSTKDKDQDSWVEGSCAQSHGGAWWYKTCDKANLNGVYYTPGQLPDELTYKGVYWNDFRGPQYSLLRARIMIRALSR